jgi:hypothetical protein
LIRSHWNLCAVIIGIRIDELPIESQRRTESTSSIVALEQAIARYRAAVDMKNELGPNFVVRRQCYARDASNGTLGTRSLVASVELSCVAAYGGPRVRIHFPPAKSLLRTCGYVDPCRRDGLFAVAVDNCQSWLKLLNAPSQNHLQIAPSPKAVSTALAISPSISSLYHLDLN